MASDPAHRQGPTIRRGGRADAGAIAEVVVRGWQAAYRGLLSDAFLDGLSVDARAAAWENRFEYDTGGLMAVWLVELDGRPVGFLGSGPPHDPDVAPPAGEVYSVYLLPEVWRLGLGRRLMETAVEHWRAAGARSLVLWVMTANSRARAFYEALGWRPDGATQEFALGDEPVPELRYRLEVEG